MSLLQVGLAIDQLVNTLLGGDADEALSARAWRLKDVSKPWAVARVIIDYIFFFQHDHCWNAYLSEKYRRQLPRVYSD